MAAASSSRLQTTPSSNDDVLTPSFADISLSTSSHITKQELLRRRFHRLRQLSKVYRHHYWALMEHLRAHYRHYYWTYGVSPLLPTPHYPNPNPNNNDLQNFPYLDAAAPGIGMNSGFDAEGCGETNNNNNSNIGGGGRVGEEVKMGGSNRCAYVACKLKAMALTSFCHLHILSDPNQKLYKACNYVIKAPQQGQILCGKPILRSVVPSLCNIHLPKAQKDVKHALKKAGLTPSSSGRLAQKFHVIVSEYVHFIQSKRRAAQKRRNTCVVIKQEFST